MSGKLGAGSKEIRRQGAVGLALRLEKGALPMRAESSLRTIDDQNSAASSDHLWTIPEKYIPKPETHNVIIYGQKDWI